MNQKEKEIIWEVIDICKSIPDIKNNCDMQGLAELRVERSMQISAIYNVLYNLMFVHEDEWHKEKVEEAIREYKEFIEKRKAIWETPRT